jgi:chromate transporter
VSEQATPPGRLREVALLFLKLGIIGFGGPAAHVALMRDEVVNRRRWVDETRFLDLFGVTSFIPGPSSTELAMFLSYERAGIPGLLVGGGLFIAPAMVVVLALAWMYVRFGSLPATEWLLYGIKPVVIGIVAVAILGLGRSALSSRLAGLIAAGAVVVGLVGVNPVIALAAGGAVTYLRWLITEGRSHRIPPRPTLALTAAPAAHAAAAAKVGGWSIFAAFFKMGALAFGGGYILLAFLNTDLVHGNHWLTDKQVLDAVAVGQVTPGPVFTTATFLGYLLDGTGGAFLATLGIFAPAFLLVGLLYPLASRLRSSPPIAACVDGVNAAAIGAMAAVALLLARSAVVDVVTAVEAVLCVALLLRYRINAAWLIGAGAVIGVLVRVAGA